MKVEVKCTCGNKTVIDVNEKAFRLWNSGKAVIQEAFPELDDFSRDSLLTNMCFDCQSKLFNRPKPGEDWGDIVDECEVCGASLYSKDFDSGVCPCCQCGLGE